MKSITVDITDSKGEIIPNHPWSKNISEGGTKRMDGQAVVKYSAGMKINIGNYQSAHVEVGIELPSEVKDINNTYDEALEWTNDRLLEEVTHLQKLKKGDK